MVWMDSHQLVYQNYKQGRIDTAFYQSLQKSWQWIPSEDKLSAKPVKCYVYVIWGVDSSGNWAAMIDTNNDLDFSGETAIYPEVIASNDLAGFSKYKQSTEISFEAYQNGRVVTRKSPMVIKQLRGDFVYNFPRYATATLTTDGKETRLLVASSNFTRPSFESTKLLKDPGHTNAEEVEENDFVEIGQNIELGSLLNSKKFKNLGVDWYSESLILEGIDSAASAYLMQAGYLIEPFEANEFSTGKTISLNNLKGKYVYIDFWGTWCKGCVEDMPSLNKLYSKLDKSEIEFVGIVADRPEKLTRFMKQNKILWPQILSDSANQLIEKYKITGFPTSLLLDENGKIMAMNLRNEDLRFRLNQILKTKPEKLLVAR